MDRICVHCGKTVASGRTRLCDHCGLPFAAGDDTPQPFQARRAMVWLGTAVGCLVTPLLTFALVIAWADYSIAKPSEGTPFGILAAIAFISGLLLLGRVIAALRRT